MAVTTVDPKNVIVSIGGVQMSGFVDGTFLEISADVQQFTKVVGADGYTTRVKSNDYGATLTLTLAQSSPSNDVLSGFFNADKLANAGIVPILIRDLSGSTVVFSATGWIQQFPDISFSNEITDRAWIFDLADVEMVVGGSGVSS